MQHIYKQCIRIIAYSISIPARARGMKIGRGVIIGPGYNFLSSDFSKVELGEEAVIGKNAFINPIKTLHSLGKIQIGQKTNIGISVTLSSIKQIEIGDECLIGYHVSFLDHDHNVENSRTSPVSSGLTVGEPVKIGSRSFIGAHSFILKGVKLGTHCVVGANSVVTKSFPSYSVIGGNPARLIKKIRK